MATWDVDIRTIYKKILSDLGQLSLGNENAQTFLENGILQEDPIDVIASQAEEYLLRGKRLTIAVNTPKFLIE